MAANSNIYSYSRTDALKRFSPYVSGDESGLFAVVCDAGLSAAARDALEKTAASLGYGAAAPLFIDTDADSSTIGPEDLFALLEAVDPLCIVVAQPESLQLLCRAYRIEPPAQPAFRMFGREVRAIPDMNRLMETPQGKQRAWAVLKTLPRIGS